MMQQTPPYNTGKVKIGLMHTPKPPPMTRDEEQIQAVLLGIRPEWSVFIEGAILYVAFTSLFFSAIFFLLAKD